MLKDHVAQIPVTKLPDKIRCRGNELLYFSENDLAALPRTELSVAVIGILSRSASELSRCADRPDDPEHLARGVRTIFELNLILRNILTSKDNLMQWLTLRVKEEIDIINGALRLKHEGTTAGLVETLQQHVASLEKYLRDRGLSMPKRLPPWADLAKAHGVEDEYRALYGLYSKFVHPSAWTVVKPDLTWGPLLSDLFIVHAQLYACDSTMRACEALGIGHEVLERGAWASVQ